MKLILNANKSICKHKLYNHKQFIVKQFISIPLNISLLFLCFIVLMPLRRCQKETKIIFSISTNNLNNVRIISSINLIIDKFFFSIQINGWYSVSCMVDLKMREWNHCLCHFVFFHNKLISQ